MYSRNDFKITKAQDILSPLKGKYSLSEKDVTREEVNNTLEKLVFDLSIHEDAPLYVLTRTLYCGDDDLLTYAKFTVRPSSKCALRVDDCKHSFKILKGANFYNIFITEMSKWFDTYTYLSLLETNLDALNSKIARIIDINELDMKIEFTLGEGIVDASDTYLKAGLSVDVIQNLTKLPLFDTCIEEREIAYSNQIVDTLKELNKPYELLKVKSIFTKDLGIYTRKTIYKMLRKCTNRRLDYVRMGVGYVDTGEVFAVVEKKGIRKKEIPTDLEGVLDISPLINATEKDKKDGVSFVLSRYKVSPIYKEDGTPAYLEKGLIL